MTRTNRECITFYFFSNGYHKQKFEIKNEIKNTITTDRKHVYFL